MSQLVTLYMAGHEPTAGLVGNGVLGLLAQPDELARLRDEPALMHNAVSELLRFDGPNQFVRRITTQPTRRRRRRAARPVRCCSLVSRPRTAIPGAGATRPTRSSSTARTPNQHLQFGGGMHACLGSHLARLQAERFLGAFLSRLDGLELAGDPVWSTRMFIRGLSSLPVRCSVRA